MTGKKWYMVKGVDTRKFSPKADHFEKEIKRLEVAAQTPFEKGKRRKRMQQSRAHS